MYKRENMICSFCVNDYHLAVIIVPYIYKVINENKKVITFLDRDLEDISKRIIDTNEKFWKEKDKVKNVDFKKTKFDKLAEKFESVKDGDIIIVVGEEKFIERINRLIINFHTNFTIVNCFNISDIAKNENFKMSNYGKILNTKGLEKIQKLDFV